MIDEFTMERSAIEAARWFTARTVIITLKNIFAVQGALEHLRSDRSDNKPKLIAKAIQEWLARACVRTPHVRKASLSEIG